MFINSKIIESQLVFLNLSYEQHQADSILNKLRIRIENTKPIYKNLLNVFFLILSLFRYILFFIPSTIFYSYIFKLFNKLPSPFNLVTKLVRGYILLDFFEENE